MHDWERLVRAHAGTLARDPHRNADIHAELAAHLEDAYDAARRLGCSDEEAVARALSEVGAWTTLARRISAAETKGGAMVERMKTMYLPGAVISGCAAALAIAAISLGSEQWADPRGWVHAAAACAALIGYALFGAAGAAWSRSAGGTRRERLIAALTPALLHAAIVIPAIAVATLGHVTAAHELAPLNPQLRVIAALIVAPAAALLAGAWPFLDAETSL